MLRRKNSVATNLSRDLWNRTEQEQTKSKRQGHSTSHKPSILVPRALLTSTFMYTH